MGDHFDRSMEVDAALEPAASAKHRNGDVQLGTACEVSKAISLKRIADALEKLGGGSVTEMITAALTAPINHYGEGIGEAIQGQMERGQR